MTRQAGPTGRTFQPWSERAACLNLDPELWFPERGESNRAAKRVCAACPVRDECLEYALDAREPYGVWGGLSEQERSQLNRRQVA